MKIFQKYLVLITLIVMTSNQGFTNDISIEDIVKNPKNYDGEQVTVTGLVKQYTPGNAKTTSFYLLQGDYGGILTVNTADPEPETFKKYKVTGILYYNSIKRNAFISEKSKVLLDVPHVIISDPPVETETVNETGFNLFDTNTLLIGGLGLILLILVIVLVTRKKKVEEPAYEANEEPMPKSEPAQESFSSAESTDSSASGDNDFKTIKINRSADPKTLAFIPGDLTIISGADSGKSFKIAGYPTPAGSIVTIGREKVKGEKEYSHIQLVEQTVSRKQAEIISKNGNLNVKNLSETNFTVVDGVELTPGQITELKPNSTIRTGEVEFKYTV